MVLSAQAFVDHYFKRFVPCDRASKLLVRAMIAAAF